MRFGSRSGTGGEVGGLPARLPDGQLEQIIEVMLGTSARIGEVLAIRKCDVDVTSSPATVRICGTIVSPAGKPTHRQPHPRRRSRLGPCRSRRFTAEVLRQRLVVAAERPRSPAFRHPERDPAHDQQRPSAASQRHGGGGH